MTDNKNNSCSVKQKHFDNIFDKFFYTNDLKVNIPNLDKSKIYNNYEVHQVHIKNSINIDDFLYGLFEHITIFSGELYNNFTIEKLKYKKSIDRLKKYFDKLANELENLRKEDLDDKKFQGKISGLKEVGEIILFFLTEGLLEAEIVISKIQTKTSSSMPVFGADGIHISKDGGKIYFGEAKINSNFEYSKKQSRDSIQGFISGVGLVSFELQVITSQLNNIPDYKRQTIFNLIDPYHNEIEDIDKMPYDIVCLLSYEDDDYKLFLGGGGRKKYEEKIHQRIEKLLSYYKLRESELKDKKIVFFLMPFIDVLSFLKAYGLKIRNQDMNTNNKIK